MSTLREAAQAVVDRWASDESVQFVSRSDGQRTTATVSKNALLLLAERAMRAELAKPDARPAPAEPQPERDFAAEVDHWMKRSKEWRKRAEAAEALLSTQPAAPQPAGGEREAPADILTRLRNTPNWMRESYGSWKDCVLKYDRAPFEAAEEIERLRAALSQPVAQQEHTREQLFALREAHAIQAEGDFFAPRPVEDGAMQRRAFNAGFVRGFEAGITATKGDRHD